MRPIWIRSDMLLAGLVRAGASTLKPGQEATFIVANAQVRGMFVGFCNVRYAVGIPDVERRADVDPGRFALKIESVDLPSCSAGPCGMTGTVRRLPRSKGSKPVIDVVMTGIIPHEEALEAVQALCQQSQKTAA